MGQLLLISSVLMAGFFSFFAPCTFALVPVYIGLMTDESGKYRSFRIGPLTINSGAIINSLAFVAGLSVTFIILGFGAGILGGIVYSSWITVVGGFFIILLGISQMEIIKLPSFIRLPSLRIKNKGTGVVKTFLTGLAFSLGWTPCVSSILGAVLLTSASSGQALYGAFLMLIYSMGLAIPFIILAIASGTLLTRIDKLEPHLGTIKKVGGAIVALMGVVLMTGQLTTLTAWFEHIFS